MNVNLITPFLCFLWFRHLTGHGEFCWKGKTCWEPKCDGLWARDNVWLQ